MQEFASGDGTGASSPDFRAIYESEATYVFATLRRLGVPESDLPDVTHDVFVTVVRRLADYDHSRALRPWLFGIAYRLAADYRRLARHKHEVSDASSDPPDAAPAADEQLAEEQTRRLVIDALQCIDHDRRGIFIMHDLDEQPMAEVATVFAIPVNTAYSRLRVARKEFEAAVRRLMAQRGER